MQIFFNNYIYKRSADTLWASCIFINSIIEIIVFFFYGPNTGFTSLYDTLPIRLVKTIEEISGINCKIDTSYYIKSTDFGGFIYRECCCFCT